MYFHSVTLDEDKCRGCTNCIKRCPTEAIRVRKSKARITKERCIDCGECIRICPYHAKKAVTDPLESMNNYNYTIAIPAPTLYGQFKPEYSRNALLNALKSVGFNEVFEVAAAAEIVSCATRKLLENPSCRKPLISSACPAVVRLIQLRFPNLIENLVKLDSPMELAASTARNKAVKEKGLEPEDIGVFFITPCAAKATSIKAPYGKEKSQVDYTISIKDIYVRMLESLDKASESNENLEKSGFEGIRWANSGGEGLAAGTEKFLAVDGIHNVVTILDEIENERIQGVDFIEALSCQGGCLGGPLTVENLYVAKTRIKKHVDESRDKKYTSDISFEAEQLKWTAAIEPRPVMKLDEDIITAMKMLEELESINNSLPGLDCGSCGAPNCRALAEDIVRGIANETDCIFKLREKVRNLAEQMAELESKMPPVMDKEKQMTDNR